MRIAILALLLFSLSAAGASQPQSIGATVVLRPAGGSIRIDHLFYETGQGRTLLPAQLTGGVITIANRRWMGEAMMADGHRVRLRITPQGRNFDFSLTATPAMDIVKWGLALESSQDEYFTGLFERVIDGPQQASWVPGISAAMNLRGQKIEMIVKPTTSIYAPFYLSSRGYGVFVKGTWPGLFDFEATAPYRNRIRRPLTGDESLHRGPAGGSCPRARHGCRAARTSP